MKSQLSRLNVTKQHIKIITLESALEIIVVTLIIKAVSKYLLGYLFQECPFLFIYISVLAVYLHLSLNIFSFVLMKSVYNVVNKINQNKATRGIYTI